MGNKNKVHWVLEIPEETRNQLLSMFPPTFPNVYCNYVTLVYGVDKNYKVPGGLRRVLINGIHRDEQSEALWCAVPGEGHEKKGVLQVLRPNENRGRPFHITLSVADGVEPATAGFLNPDKIELLDDPIEVFLKPRQKPRWKATPDHSRG